MTTSKTPARSTLLGDAILANVVLLAAFGAVAVFAPGWLLRGLGVQDPSFAEFGTVRACAALALAFGTLLWSARAWLASPAGRPAVRNLALAYLAGAIVIGSQQWTVWSGRTGLALVLACAGLAVAYGGMYRRSAGSPSV